MRFLRSATAVLFAFVVAFGVVGAAPAADSVNVTMAAQGGSSESGSATLTKQGDKETKVAVNLSGASGQQPAHIHKGSCSNLDPKPAFPLSPVVDGKSETVVKVPLADLEKGGYAINVHKSTQDLKTYVSCGEIASK
jgi:hypothetical protein